MGLARFDGHPPRGASPRKGCPEWRLWRRRSPVPAGPFTAEFKAEIVERCRQGDRWVAQVAKDFNLVESAVRRWVEQADIDSGQRRWADQRRPGGARKSCGGRTAACRPMSICSSGPWLSYEGDPVKLDGFIEAEEAAGHRLKHCCDLFQVSRAAYYQRKQQIPSDREVSDRELLEHIATSTTSPTAPTGRPGSTGATTPRVACGRRRVARLTRRTAWRAAASGGGAGPRPGPTDETKALDLIQRRFGPSEVLDPRYVGDITYLATWEGGPTWPR